MKKTLLFLVIFLAVLVFSVNAADMIILKDGNVIEAKIIEIHPTEIRYKRADNLNGPTLILSKDRVLSIKFESGLVEIVSASPSAGQGSGQTGGSASPSAGQASGQTGGTASSGGQQPGVQTLLQTSLTNILNTMPAISIAGNNLKFQFNSDNWTAMLNGESFSTGTIEVENTNDGAILNLKQTHIWPGAVAGKAVGKLASKVPGGAVAGSALNAAGGLAGAVEASGPVIVLGYKAGPPAKLSYLRSTTAVATVSTVSTDSAANTPSQSTPMDAQWRSEGSVAHPSFRSEPTTQFSVASEKIKGQVREVLTLKVNMKGGHGWARGEFILENQTMIQQLQNGSGVRFKVLGDGKPWELRISTQKEESEFFFYGADITNKKGEVVAIDIPFSILQSVDNKVSLQKDNITGLHLQIRDNSGKSVASTIKVFDFEIY